LKILHKISCTSQKRLDYKAKLGKRDPSKPKTVNFCYSWMPAGVVDSVRSSSFSSSSSASVAAGGVGWRDATSGKLTQTGGGGGGGSGGALS